MGGWWRSPPWGSNRPCHALPPVTDPTTTPEGHAVRAYSPGRVNLMGDHTDYNEGLALPMAIDLGTEVAFVPDPGDRVVLRSAGEPELADVDAHMPFDPAALRGIEPGWARYVAAVVAAVRPPSGGTGVVTTTLPVGAGLSSSAALEVALAMALGLHGEPLSVARTCQRAEQAATGVATGIMDQLTVTAAAAGCAMRIDFSDLSHEHVPVPEEAEFVVVHCGEQHALERSPYAARRAECEAASFRLGPLGLVEPGAVLGLPDPVLRRRARHVVSECDRVRWFAGRAGGRVTC